MAATVIGAALLTGAGVHSRREGYAAEAAARPATDAEIAAECQERYTDLNPHLVGEPVERFVARDGDAQARVYVSEPDNWMIVCRSDSLGVRVAAGTRMERGTKDRIDLFGAEDSVLKGNLLLGGLPKGSATIQAALASGRVITGSHDSDVFVIWTTTEDSFRGAQLTATGADGSVIATAVAPSPEP
ncbi:hypothetical protein [Actinoplanes xinjiangensis]|uniref:hypothetical protein n=1 Tax=Actinoplanes xinjiangensis TaxID=512350 RepID=UPI003423927B